MTLLEILLLLMGAVIFTGGFVLPEIKKGHYADKDLTKAAEAAFKQVTDKNIDSATSQMEELASKKAEEVSVKTERELEKITNEKIMAVDEYGKTVIEEIEKNHKEVMFLYDMLNNKTIDIKNTVRKAETIKQLETADESVPEQSGMHTLTGMELLKEKEDRKKADNASQILKIKVPKTFVPDIIEGNTETQKEHPETKISEPAVTDMPEKMSGAGDTKGRIIELHKAGRSNVEIARELGIGVGEVKLKVSLIDAGAEEK